MWWHNAPLLRAIATALFSLSVLLVLYGAGHYVAHLPGLFPLHSVRLIDAPKEIDADLVRQVIHSKVQGNFLTVDIDRLRVELEKLPWARRVIVRREFPDRLAVKFEEHQVLARWNDNSLVNIYGEVFEGKSDLELPDFYGQEGSSKEVLQQYVQFGKLLQGLNFKINQISLSPRRAWRLHLDSDMVLELGREDVQQRLTRFVTVYPYAAEKIHQNDSGAVTVDLRYRNGFAVKQDSEHKKG